MMAPKSKAEDWFLFTVDVLDTPMNPTLENLLGSFKRWEYRSRTSSRWRQLTRRRIVQSFRALWKWLRARGYGYLQQSVWLAVDAITEDNLPLDPLRLTPETYLVIEGRPAAPADDRTLVEAAWDFTRVNGAYERCMELAVAGRRLAARAIAGAGEFQAWLEPDRRAWSVAVAQDPFLPRGLWPGGYRGEAAWNARNLTFTMLAREACGGHTRT